MFYDDENQNKPKESEDDRAEIKENRTEPEGSFNYDDNKKAENNYNGYNDFNGGHNNYENGNGGRKKKNDNAYMSKKAVGWIVALCLVVSIICGICANAVTGALKGGVGETTTDGIVKESTTTSLSDSTKNPEIITPIATDGAKDIPTVAVATNGSVYTSYADVVEKCINSVVQIEITETGYDIFGREVESAGAGSGVIFSKDGFIITNYHVVGANTKTIKVILYDGTEYEGQYICGDESIDVAVIKINKNDCVAAKMGDSSALRLGSDVFAIGNPLGYGLTVSEGIVSAISRTVTIENTTMILMQTTAAINSGNSGGGLFNMKGELVGITNAKVGGTSVESMGYAIPSERVVKCINDFSKYGYVTGIARLGIMASNSVKIGRSQFSGLVSVTSVKEDGTAAKAGIQVNDIIYSVNGTECGSIATLTELLTKYKVGDTVKITILRPTSESLSAVSYNAYLKACEEIELQVTFIEFNPVA